MMDRSLASLPIVTSPAPSPGPLSVAGSDLLALLEQARERARDRGAPVVASLVVPMVAPDHRVLALALDRLEDDAFVWRPPGSAGAMLGAGLAHAAVASGPSRFAAARTTWKELCDAAVVQRLDADAPSLTTGPVLVGGFAFDPLSARDPMWDGFPDGLLILPRLLVTTQGARGWLSLNASIEASSDPAVEAERLLAHSGRLEAAILWGQAVDEAAWPPGAALAQDAGAVQLDEGDTTRWKDAVAVAARAVQVGRLQKAVLARRARARLPRRVLPGRTLAALMESYPECYAFAVRREGRTFLGATPERLIALEGQDLRTMCLAGSISRGSTPQEDAELGARLLQDPKNRHEHRVVVDMIRSSLEDLCTSLDVPEQPALLKVRNVQHLYTPVRGRLKAAVSVLDLVARLHPTPAVGGQPAEEALELIRKIEGMDRGWYAGPVGWVGPAGDGEFAVALRSALLRDDEAVLFAGCGIVGDSDPESEFDESALKMRPVFQALERSLV